MKTVYRAWMTVTHPDGTRTSVELYRGTSRESAKRAYRAGMFAVGQGIVSDAGWEVL